MSRKFIAAVLAVSTAIAGFSAVPARAASEEDIARLLAGAATIFIIGKAIQNARDDDDDDDKKDRKPRVTEHTPTPTYHFDRPYKKGHSSRPPVVYHQKPLPKVVPRDVRSRHQAALPARCVRQIEGGRVQRVVMGRCLERNDVNLRTLPKACRMTVETRRGATRAYALPCLRHRGYTLARN